MRVKLAINVIKLR